MTEVLLPDSRDRRLTFFLAMEEYLARDVREDLVFLWQTGPTVIFGRNQDMAAEVNVPFCEERGIALVRRKSGGGCVYSDRGNLMVSCITPDTNAAAVFARYAAPAASCSSSRAVRSFHVSISSWSTFSRMWRIPRYPSGVK